MRSILLVLALVGSSFGETRPSFFLDDVAWRATHIVIASEGETIDGKLTVVEAIAGHLKTHAMLELPELAAFRGSKSRQIYENFSATAKRVTGARVILFLTRTAGGWKQAAQHGGMDISVAWIEDGKAYALVQIINPGSVRMVAVGSEETLRKRIVAIRAVRQQLAKAEALEVPLERARAIAPLVGNSIGVASAAAVSALGSCGRDGLPVILRLIEESKLAAYHGMLVKELARAGGVDAGPSLLRILKRDLHYWCKTGPTLPAGWWNGKDVAAKDRVRLQQRYSRTLAAVRALARVQYREAAATTKQLADFWRSLPQLHDKSGLDQMTEEAEAASKSLRG